MRDVIRNRMLQLLCHLAMEPPVNFTADEVRDEKVKVLRSVMAAAPGDVPGMAARGQYTRGVVGGVDVPGYTEEDAVPPDSHTETFAALRLEVDNWRWAGVPFYLRTGKRLARKVTEIAITLRPVPHLGFAQEGSVGVRPNVLVLTLQPSEGVSMQLAAKIPGTKMRLTPVNMEFLYGTSSMPPSPDAYERLILDALGGDATLFARNDEVEAQWRIIDPVLEVWESSSDPPPPYPAGSRGPAGAERILLPGHRWRAI
jgi:glucose-6-phosphate 1-dehydrogenase